MPINFPDGIAGGPTGAASSKWIIDNNGNARFDGVLTASSVVVGGTSGFNEPTTSGTIGQLLISGGSSGASGWSTLAGTSSQITVSNVTGAITLSLPTAVVITSLNTTTHTNSGVTILGNGSLDYLSIIGGATTVGPTISSAGETNTPLTIQSAGTGVLDFKIPGSPSGSNNAIRWWINGSQVWDILGNGSLSPAVDNAVAIGTSVVRSSVVWALSVNAGAGTLTVGASSATAATITSTVASFSGSVVAAGDGGGPASSTAFTNATNTTHTNAYVVAGGQGATTQNTGWLKIYVNGVVSWTPFWSNATP